MGAIALVLAMIALAQALHVAHRMRRRAPDERVN